MLWLEYTRILPRVKITNFTDLYLFFYVLPQLKIQVKTRFTSINMMSCHQSADSCLSINTARMLLISLVKDCQQIKKGYITIRRLVQDYLVSARRTGQGSFQRPFSPI